MSVGHEVCVWNRNPTKTKPLTDAGAKLFADPAELVDGCEAVIVMLLNDAADDAVYRGPNGILRSGLAGKLVIDMRTVRPDTMRSGGAAGRCVCLMSGGWKHGPREGRQAVRSCRGREQRC